MKIRYSIIISVALVLTALTTHAQNWLTTGNNGINPSVNFLGTKDSKALPFRTHNIERMRITNSGRIGIGTTSPQQKLDVHGSINLDSSLYLNNIKELYHDDYGLHLGSIEEQVEIGYTQTSTSLAVTGGDNAISANASLIGIYSGISNNNPHIFSYAVYDDGKGGAGVYSTSDSSVGVYGVTKNPNSYGGYFSGGIFSTASYTGSDEKLKQNIHDFSSAMDIIKQLHPKQYQYRQDGNYKLMNLPQGSHYGLIAQDVEKVLPDLIKDSKFNVDQAVPRDLSFDTKNPNKKISLQSSKLDKVIDFKALNYTELIPILIKGMQEQQQSIEELKKINQQQQEQINQLKNLIETRLRAPDISSAKTTTINSVSLLQNVPNPYKNNTTIQYSLPAQFSSAQIIITDNAGTVLKQINVSGKGKGSVNVNTSSLAAGSYNYSLWVDGKLIGTKQMVLQK
jgi:hypothetical protein